MTDSQKITHEELVTLIFALFRESRELSGHQPGPVGDHDLLFVEADVRGLVTSLAACMYDKLSDNDFLINYVPQVLREKLDELRQKSVMITLSE